MQSNDKTYSTASLVLFSTFVGFFLVLFGPLEVYVHNREEFSSIPSELIGLLTMVAAGVSFAILILLFLVQGTARNVVVRFLAFLLLCSWLLSNFLYGDYGRLDGAGLKIPALSWLSVVQTAALVIALVIIIKLSKKNVIRMTGVVFLAGLVSFIGGVRNFDLTQGRFVPLGFPPGLTEFSPSRNVLHVVLDQMGIDLFLLALEQDRAVREAFDGFTVFTDTLSVYPSTQMSIVTLMTGEVYRNEEPKKSYIEKMRSRDTGVKQLESLGFELNSHTKCRWGVLDQCTLNNSRIVDRDVKDIEILQLLDIYLFKSLPDYLKPFIYNEEQWFLLALSSHNKYLKFQSGVAHILFENYIDQMSVSESMAPRYIFFHSLVTHAPSDLDAECNVLEAEQVTKISTPPLVRCGLLHFVRLLDKLKSLGVYDNTMIVLSSDHGDYRIDESVDIEAFERNGFEADMVTRSFASMAIKPPGTRGAATFSSAPVSLRDIPHTILAAYGLEVSPESSEDTRDAFSVSESERREREYLFYRWKHEYWRKEGLPPITPVRVSGPMKDPASWQKLAPVESQVDQSPVM